MKKSTIWKSLIIGAIIIASGNWAMAQEDPMPAEFRQHGINSSNNSVPSELVDSVTVGSTMRYGVIPDATIPGVSTFTWGISGLGTLGGTTSNIETITFGSTAGPGTITVRETAPTTPACPGSSTTIDFRVVSAPTANFGADPDPQCYSTGQLTFLLPITVTTPIAGSTAASTVRVRYTVYNSSNVALAGLSNIDVELQAGAVRTITVQLPAGTPAGTYYASISSITDRISRKPATPILGTSTAGNESINMVIHPVPTTGPIFHVPNM